MTQWQEVYNFWFGTYQESSEYLRERMPIWFGKNEAFDHKIRTSFAHLHDALDKKTFPLSSWQTSPQAWLSLIILFDQFPRNVYRGEARTYAYDSFCLDIAKECVRQGMDRQLAIFERMFIYLPYEHSENLGDQKTSVDLFAELAKQGEGSDLGHFSKMAYDYALDHMQVIEQFGRFPHRNRILGRESTKAEEVFIATHKGW